MKLEEAIAHAKEVAEEYRKTADGWYAGGCSYAQEEGNVCLECAKEHEQLAEWLEELKALKECKGDLISREALKQMLPAPIEDEYKRVHQIIDNVPTVESEITIEQAVAKIHETGLLSEHDKMMKEWVDIKCAYCNKHVRPQGEWVAREDMDYIDKNGVVHKHFMCNKCGLIHDFIDGHTSQYNFCPNCGALMKGGAENG